MPACTLLSQRHMVAIVGWRVYSASVMPISLVTVYLQDEGLRSSLGDVVLVTSVDEVLEVPDEVAVVLELEAREAHGFA